MLDESEMSTDQVSPSMSKSENLQDAQSRSVSKANLNPSSRKASVANIPNNTDDAANDVQTDRRRRVGAFCNATGQLMRSPCAHRPDVLSHMNTLICDLLNGSSGAGDSAADASANAKSVFQQFEKRSRQIKEQQSAAQTPAVSSPPTLIENAGSINGGIQDAGPSMLVSLDTRFRNIKSLLERRDKNLLQNQKLFQFQLLDTDYNDELATKLPGVNLQRENDDDENAESTRGRVQHYLYPQTNELRLLTRNAGVELGLDSELQLLVVAMRSLTQKLSSGAEKRRNSELVQLRFWGKIIGTDSDYYVCEVDFGKDDGENGASSTKLAIEMEREARETEDEMFGVNTNMQNNAGANTGVISRSNSRFKVRLGDKSQIELKNNDPIREDENKSGANIFYPVYRPATQFDVEQFRRHLTPHPTKPPEFLRELVMQHIAAQRPVKKSKKSDDDDVLPAQSTSWPSDMPPLPRIKSTKTEPVRIEREPFAKGVNRYVYYVTTKLDHLSTSGGGDADELWERLPLLLPSVFTMCRNSKVVRRLTGNLRKRVYVQRSSSASDLKPEFAVPEVDFVYERDYLRCQIARITHATFIAPQNDYVVDEETNPNTNEEEQQVERNPDTDNPSTMLRDVAAETFEGWVHARQYILPQGRVNYHDPFFGDNEDENAEEDEEDQIMMEDEEQNGEEGEQGEDGALPTPNFAKLYPIRKRRKARRPPTLEPEQGPAALTALPEDNSNAADAGENMPNSRAWSFKCTCKHLPQMGAICIRSATWPGACCVFADGKSHNIYVGTGQKCEINQKDENQQIFPPCQKEFPHRLDETTDPSVEQEAKKSSAKPEGEEAETGGENEEEEDEEGSEEEED